MMNRPLAHRLRRGPDLPGTRWAAAGTPIRWRTPSWRRRRSNEWFPYHHFGQWFNERTDTGTRIDSPNAHSPLSARWVWRKPQRFGRRFRAGEISLPGEPDIVHANSYQAPPVGRARLVFTVYDVSYWMHPEFTTDGNRLHCQDGVFAPLQRADGFLFISESSHREFDSHPAGLAGAQRQTVGRDPFGAQRERPVARRNTRLSEAPADRDFWLAVGTLEPRKNYETLLDALDLYWSRSPRPLPLRIAGGGGWKSDASETTPHHPRSRRPRGTARLRPSDGELRRLYASAHALIFPSWHEGFGLPVLEAMSAGAPVICSDRASLPEVGGDAVVYVDPASAESICQAMLALESDPTRRQELVDKARAQAARFSWERTARETLDFLPPRPRISWGFDVVGFHARFVPQQVFMKTRNPSPLYPVSRPFVTVAFVLLASLWPMTQKAPAQGSASPRGETVDAELTAKFGEGWYAAETAPKGPFRWMGASGQLDVVIKRAGTLVIRGQIRSIVPDNGADLFVDDKMVQAIKLSGMDWGDCLVRIPLTAGTHHLSLHSRQAGSQPAGDNRVLTICLRNFQASLEP